MKKTDVPLKWKKPKSCSRCQFLQFNGGGNQRCMLGFETTDLDKDVYWPNATPYEDAVVTIKPAEPCYKPVYLSERVAAYKAIVYPQHRPMPHPGFEHFFNKFIPDNN